MFVWLLFSLHILINFILHLLQSGNESRSRAESTLQTDDNELIDYKALYEAEK